MAMTGYFLLLAPASPIAWDFIAYQQAANAAVLGESFVGLQPDHGGGEYVYPPIAVLAFLPYTVLGTITSSFIVHTLFNLVMLGVLALVTIREIERLGVPLTDADRSLIIAFATISLYPLISIGLGQIDPLIAVIIALVFITIERGRGSLAGVLLAVATVFKLFPAALVVWPLIRRRWSATGTLLASVGIAALASILAFGFDTNRLFVEFILHERSRLVAFAEGVSPNFFAVTLIRPISAMLPDVTPVAYLIISISIVVPPLVYIYRRSSTRLDHHIAYLATLIAVLIALPSTNLNHFIYLYFPLVVLLYTLTDGRAKRLLAAGTIVLLIPVQPTIIAVTLGALPIPSTLVDPLHSIAMVTMSIASVGLLGALILLIGCLAYARAGTRPPGPSHQRVDKLA